MSPTPKWAKEKLHVSNKFIKNVINLNSNRLNVNETSATDYSKLDQSNWPKSSVGGEDVEQQERPCKGSRQSELAQLLWETAWWHQQSWSCSEVLT